METKMHAFREEEKLLKILFKCVELGLELSSLVVDYLMTCPTDHVVESLLL